jgi:SWIM zinc finger
MKQVIYNVQVALTSTVLLACTCTCKAGSVDKEKIVCVHILPVIFQIGQIMWKGLSEHLLLGFSKFYLGENNKYLAIHQPEIIF